jgi:hypothetical protein
MSAAFFYKGKTRAFKMMSTQSMFNLGQSYRDDAFALGFKVEGILERQILGQFPKFYERTLPPFVFVPRNISGFPTI